MNLRQYHWKMKLNVNNPAATDILRMALLSLEVRSDCEARL